MEIKKLLMLTTSGSRVKYADIEEGTFENMLFESMEDIYISIATEDLIALDKLGVIHIAKEGDFIIKSNCQEIFGIIPGDSTISYLIEFVKEKRDIRQALRKKLYEEQDSNSTPVQGTVINEI